MKELILPKSKNANQTENSIITEGSIVIVGANGSGKTRLGTWIEFNSNQKEKVHRVSAQKSLTIPDTTSPVSIKKAKSMLHYGYYRDDRNDNLWQYKRNLRWGQKPETFLLNDYDKLLTYLFSENYEKVLEYKRLSEHSEEKVVPPITKLDKVVKIWESVVLHRKLMINSSNISAYFDGGEKNKYNASDMSDGERVILYLIGECIAAHENSIIIIDEPELHLHKAIQRRLWDEIEAARPDCLFTYLTHDLDFAVTRVGGERVWMSNYDGENFDWIHVSSDENIPEDIYLKIIGSRNPIIFIEGEKGSYDEQLYSNVYPDYTIICLGSSSKVIEATKSFDNLNSLHNLKCNGIIDRDFKPDEFIQNYEKKNILFPDVAEVENLFLVEELLEVVAKKFCVDNSKQTVSKVKEWIINQFESNLEQHSKDATVAYINYSLNSFNGKSNNIDELKGNYKEFVKAIDIEKHYNSVINNSKKLIENQDYNEILKVYNNKTLVAQVGKFFDIKPSAFTRKVKNIIDEGNGEILEAIRSYLPRL
ncbi:DUF4435 domain-containing protein [Clostridiaceae bacterium HSG29]|nr:DUF4435 domain-containing protein [Clostridiaceae bacterium HSG29]